MNRTEFEALRDLPSKRIRQDIRWTRRTALRPLLETDGIVIENTEDLELRRNLNFNPENGSKTVNVYVRGLGPICRLDVDGTRHGDAGRSHKHALREDRCPDRNLPDGVMARHELSGQSMREVFQEFCRLALIEHEGTFQDPEQVES